MQIDADPDSVPDPAYKLHPDPDFYLMRMRIRMRIQVTKMMRIRIRNIAYLFPYSTFLVEGGDGAG